ncbi:Fez family zinc finger protein 1 [Armadillidium nasatum]|uniref:Fez family zinc finger protein 1 n=1 Tax=Armadillidium nasatum TaxID=96803 RepID=A0A5N5SVR2_9CRUS|nr:Fez family zinc finger protein 1 [Armadillidium nasatum]
MEEDFTLQDGVLTLKPLDEGLDSDDLVKSVVYRDETPDSSKINSIEIKAFIDDNFNENEAISKQIIVQRIDDIIDGDQFKRLRTNLGEDEFSSEETNITIIQDNLEDNLSSDNDVTQIISEPDVHCLFNNNISKRLNENTIANENLLKNVNEILIKEEPLDDANDSDADPLEIPSSSGKQGNESKSLNFIRKKEAEKVDKDDPRSRLHFVKYMKKDGKEFLHQYTLTRHLPTHTDERNYKCKICGKAFRQMSTLAQHRSTHSEFRPYVCDICTKTFSRVSTLTSHKKIHTDSKPHTHIQNGNIPQLVNNRFKCSHCSESFSKRAQLRHHEEHTHDVVNILSSKNSLRPNLIPTKSPLLKKKKMGNIRIIQMHPDDDDDKMDENEMDSKGDEKIGILIEPIDTKAMHKALSNGHIPFALLKPAKGTPVVVKVQLCDGSKHVPVVATIHQKVDENGEIHIDIEPPSDEESNKKDERTVITSSNCREEQPFNVRPWRYFRSVKDGNILPQEINENNVLEEIGFSSLADSEDLGYGLSSQITPQLIEISPPQESSLDLVSTTVSLANEISSSKELDNTVQYLRPTENIGEYEVIVPEESSLFGGSHNVIQHLKPLIEDNETVTVDHSHLAALMNALQTAGYEMQTDEVSQTPQIILNAVEGVDDAIIVDNQHIQVVVSDEQEMSSADVASMTIDGTEASDAVLQ